MANRIKEEEKNERIIRGLLKHPANKRCINCNSLGPQYVCTNFWTFICTNCSGLHREFTHRVKSISMAKFTSQEVIALQEGGNERAREVYFKEWDPQRHSYPDSSHLDRLRDFIKHVYLERRYAGGKNTDDPPRVKGERADYDEHQRPNTDRSGSRSPPYNDPYERQFGGSPGSTGRSDVRNSHHNYEARSPSYEQGDYRSPNHSEMRDEIRRYDKDGNNVQSPKSYNNRISDELPKPGVSDHQKGEYESSPPMVRAVREILGSDIPPLRVGELLKSNGGKASNSPLETQVSTSSKQHNDGNSAELKRVNSVSLIDFSLDSEPLASSIAKDSFPLQTGSTPASSGGWASFDISSRQKASEAVSTAGDLESVFAQLSVHSSVQVANSSISPAARSKSFLIENNGGQRPAMHQQPSFPVSSQSSSPPVHAPIQQVSPFPSAVQGSAAVIDGQSTQPVMHLSNRPTVFGNSQNAFEAKANGMKELPADLFTGLYSTSSASYPGWRMVPHHGMVYRVQYPVMMPLAYGTAQQPLSYGAVQHPVTYDSAQQSATTFHSPPVSTNPFDFGNDSAPGLNPMINPRSASLQTAVRNPSNPLSLPQWASPQQFSHPSSGLPGPYMMQQFPNDMPHHLSSNFPPSINPGGGVRNEFTPYSVSNSSQLPARTNSNPFG